MQTPSIVTTQTRDSNADEDVTDYYGTAIVQA
jgi:hypothetical protein